MFPPFSRCQVQCSSRIYSLPGCITGVNLQLTNKKIRPSTRDGTVLFPQPPLSLLWNKHEYNAQAYAVSVTGNSRENLLEFRHIVRYTADSLGFPSPRWFSIQIRCCLAPFRQLSENDLSAFTFSFLRICFYTTGAILTRFLLIVKNWLEKFVVFLKNRIFFGFGPFSCIFSISFI